MLETVAIAIALAGLDLALAPHDEMVKDQQVDGHNCPVIVHARK